MRRKSRGNSLNSEVGHLSLLGDQPFDSEHDNFPPNEVVAAVDEDSGLFRCLPGPPWIINILLSELCERFSFYALRAILVLFFKERLGWSRDNCLP